MKQIDNLKTGNKFKKTEIGKIPVDWEVAKLNNICEVSGGSTPSTDIKEYWGGDINWAIPTDITNLNNNIINNTERKITVEGLNSCSASLLPVGSILLTSRATLGKCAINSVPIATNQGFANLICKEYIHNWFLFYRMKLIKKELERLGSGSTFKEIPKRSIRNILIPFPPLKEQEKIADILISVDDAIEKIRKVIDKTKELKKGLMQELFTKGIGHKKFKKTELGTIPEEWEIKRVKAIAGKHAVPIINKTLFSSLPITKPKYNEQNKIADILISVDNEIENAILNKEKLEKIKKGLMQVLLTGNVRVKIKNH